MPDTVFPVAAIASRLSTVPSGTGVVPEPLPVPAATTVNATVVEAVIDADVPVIVTLVRPVAAPDVAVNVTVVLLVELAGTKFAVTPVGSPLAEKFTLPVKPLTGLTATPTAPLCPWTTDTLPDVALKLKLATAAAETLTDWVTDAAGEYAAFPACDAVIEQLPTPMKLANDPTTVHTVGVVVVYVTARPELAVAPSVSEPPTLCAAIGPNVIVCDCGAVFVSAKVAAVDTPVAVADTR
jgi:hypothetical protein